MLKNDNTTRMKERKNFKKHFVNKWLHFSSLTRMPERWQKDKRNHPEELFSHVGLRVFFVEYFKEMLMFSASVNPSGKDKAHFKVEVFLSAFCS